MNITVTITVDLNVLQNASKCTISKEKIPKIFLGRGHSHPRLEPPPNHISGYGPAVIDVKFDALPSTNNRLTVRAGFNMQCTSRTPRAVNELGRDVETIDCSRHQVCHVDALLLLGDHHRLVLVHQSLFYTGDWVVRLTNSFIVHLVYINQSINIY